jgi:hypothetical protein
MIASCKRLMLMGAILTAFSTQLNAQSFFKDYKQYLMNIDTPYNDNTSRIINATVSRLQTTLDNYRNHTRRSFFSEDTIDTAYIVSMTDIKNGVASAIIWNSRASCYYKCRIYSDHSGIIMLMLKTDASKIVEGLNRDFVNIVKTADTSGYTEFAKKHGVIDGQAVLFTRGVKVGIHWSFITSKACSASVDSD